MELNSSLKLFLFTSCDNFALVKKSTLEHMGDKFLFSFRAVFKGYNITLHGKKEDYPTYYDKLYLYHSLHREPLSIIEKIIFVVGAIFLSFPGIFLKGLAWLRNPIIKERNGLILQTLEYKKNYRKHMDGVNQPSNSIAPFNIQTTQDQTQSLFAKYPKDIQLESLTFLNDKDVAKFARTCKQNYQLARSRQLICLREFNFFPEVVAQVLGKKTVCNSPVLSKLLEEDTNRNLRSLLHPEPPPRLLSLRNIFQELKCEIKKHIIQGHNQWWNFHPSLAKLRKGKIEILRFPKEGGLIALHIQDNSRNDRDKLSSILVIKINNKCMVILDTLNYPALDRFLNDANIETQKPKIRAFFERLVKNQPCGSFPNTLPQNQQFLENPNGIASDLLVEGPTTLEDGRPVLQLVQ